LEVAREEVRRGDKKEKKAERKLRRGDKKRNKQKDAFAAGDTRGEWGAFTPHPSHLCPAGM
jgi:hypothetical protein